VTVPDPAPGYVYLIHDPNSHMVKIGRSVNPIARMSQIATRERSLVLVSYIATADNVWLERFLHEAFAHRRVRGEWFQLDFAEIDLFRQMNEVDTLDDLPSAVVAQRVLNEANGFQWGEHDRKADIPSRGTRPVGIPEPLAVALEEYAKRNFSTLAHVVREAMLEYMKVMGVPIPPPA
jgi:hypothetical protein